MSDATFHNLILAGIVLALGAVAFFIREFWSLFAATDLRGAFESMSADLAAELEAPPTVPLTLSQLEDKFGDLIESDPREAARLMYEHQLRHHGRT